MGTDGGLGSRLGWYARRLRSMEKGEVRWRAKQLLQRFAPEEGSAPIIDGGADTPDGWAQALERFRSASDRPVLLDAARARDIAGSTPVLVAELVESAQSFADRSFAFFGYPAVTLGRPIDWHHDPFADLRWPDLPSHRLDHRVAAGDVKWIWELNRLQHLPLLAQAWLFTGESRYSAAAFEHLDSWIEQNPFGRGIAWRGAFEAGLRAISIAVAVQGLRDAPELTPERYRRIVAVLSESARRCWTERSLFSSANNHLVGEMAGLAVVAMMVPELRSAPEWERHAVEVLCAEASKQILPDGSGAEQSVGYQMATVELLHLVAALLYERDGQAPEAITDAIRRSSEFLGSLVGSFDPDPRYGDHDQEFAVRLGPEEIRTVRDHLAIVAAFGWGSAGEACDRSDNLSAQWFRAAAGPSRRAGVQSGGAGTSARTASFFAPDAGLAVVRTGRRRITMDVGSLGYLSIAAHGHADALAITLSDGDQDIIGDPGTGSYYRHPEWRAMMRGTRAHATVSVDGRDQSVIGGPFLWSRHARTRVRGVNLTGGVVDAEHDGYTRLNGRVMHRRWLVTPADWPGLLVIDLITGRGTHEVRTCWPLHPSLDVARIPDGHVVLHEQAPILRMLHAASTPLEFDDSRGDEVANTGWWSDRLESRVPAWWLSAVGRSELPVVIATLMTPNDGVAREGLAVRLRQRVIEVTWSEGSRLQVAEVPLDAAAVAIWTPRTPANSIEQGAGEKDDVT